MQKPLGANSIGDAEENKHKNSSFFYSKAFPGQSEVLYNERPQTYKTFQKELWSPSSSWVTQEFYIIQEQQCLISDTKHIEKVIF